LAKFKNRQNQNDGFLKGEERWIEEDMYEVELDEYYEARRWDKEGLPTPKKIENLGLNS